MQTVNFWGSSDDLIEVGGIKGADEFMASSVDGPVMGQFAIVGGGYQLRVIAIYDGCWSFAIAPFEEDVPMPDWAFKYASHKNGYSTLLEIEVPDFAVLIHMATD